MWTVTVPAPEIVKVNRKTGKPTKRNPWLNANDRAHWSRRVQLTKQWRALAAQALRDIDIPLMQKHVHITATIHKKRANISDAANYYGSVKACVDGFVDACLVEDDNNHFVTGPDMRAGEPGEPRIVFTINPKETENCLEYSVYSQQKRPQI